MRSRGSPTKFTEDPHSYARRFSRYGTDAAKKRIARQHNLAPRVVTDVSRFGSNSPELRRKEQLWDEWTKESSPGKGRRKKADHDSDGNDLHQNQKPEKGLFGLTDEEIEEEMRNHKKSKDQSRRNEDRLKDKTNIDRRNPYDKYNEFKKDKYKDKGKKDNQSPQTHKKGDKDRRIGDSEVDIDWILDSRSRASDDGSGKDDRKKPGGKNNDPNSKGKDGRKPGGIVFEKEKRTGENWEENSDDYYDMMFGGKNGKKGEDKGGSKQKDKGGKPSIKPNGKSDGKGGKLQDQSGRFGRDDRTSKGDIGKISQLSKDKKQTHDLLPNKDKSKTKDQLSKENTSKKVTDGRKNGDDGLGRKQDGKMPDKSNKKPGYDRDNKSQDKNNTGKYSGKGDKSDIGKTGRNDGSKDKGKGGFSKGTKDTSSNLDSLWNEDDLDLLSKRSGSGDRDPYNINNSSAKTPKSRPDKDQGGNRSDSSAGRRPKPDVYDLHDIIEEYQDQSMKAKGSKAKVKVQDNKKKKRVNFDQEQDSPGLKDDGFQGNKKDKNNSSKSSPKKLDGQSGSKFGKDKTLTKDDKGSKTKDTNNKDKNSGKFIRPKAFDFKSDTEPGSPKRPGRPGKIAGQSSDKSSQGRSKSRNEIVEIILKYYK